MLCIYAWTRLFGKIRDMQRWKLENNTKLGGM